MIRAIIPCAGYGTRMGMSQDKSKELLLDSKGRPIIEWTLKLCEKTGLTPLIITRKEKTDLIEYCEKKDIAYQIIKPKGEWMDTILASRLAWVDQNILLLPDTRFNPAVLAMSRIKVHLSLGAKFVIGVHTVQDPHKWCIVDKYKLIEKPIEGRFEVSLAMGIIGFTPYRGEHLFKELSMQKSSHAKGYAFLNDASFVELTSFKDITRTGIVQC